MKSLAESQESLLSYVRGAEGSAPGGLEFCGGLARERALEIYRNNYRESLRESLADTYPACREALTEELFDQLSAAFVASPAGRLQGPLEEYGAGFDDFLKDSPPMEVFPFLAELAALEWEIRGLFFIPPETPLSFSVSFPVHKIWSALLFPENRESIEDLPEGGAGLTLWRRGEFVFFSDPEQ